MGVFLRPRDRLCCFFFSFPLLLHLRFPVEGTAQPLLLPRLIATQTMGGLMGLRVPTSAICTLRTRPTPPAFQGVAVTLTITVIRQTPTAARTPMPVVGEPTTPASIGLRLSSAVSRTMV